jgi:hypothetical protein
MVLRDTYIISASRVLAFLALLSFSACKESSTDTSKGAADAATTPVNLVIATQAQPIRNELEETINDMNALYLITVDIRTGVTGSSKISQENIDAVFEKSAMGVGGMLVLRGSLNAVEQRFNEGILDQKQAEEMLRKMRIDLQSYQEDVIDYRKLLGVAAPAKSEKK